VHNLPAWEQSIEAQQGAMSLKPGDRIQIEIIHHDDKHEYSEATVYTVEPMGTVALGAKYGRANVKGHSIIEAEEVIKRVIQEFQKDALVQVTYLHPTAIATPQYVPPSPTAEPK
jgi:protein involved in polysaccharide export with SLBB domain